MSKEKKYKKPNITIKNIRFRLVKRGKTYLICLQGKHYQVRSRKNKQYLHGEPESCDGSCGMPDKIGIHQCSGVDNEILAELEILPRVPSGHVLVDRDDIHPAGTPITPRFLYWLNRGYSRFYRDGETIVRKRRFENFFTSDPQYSNSRYEYLVVDGKAKKVSSRSWDSGPYVDR